MSDDGTGAPPPRPPFARDVPREVRALGRGPFAAAVPAAVCAVVGVVATLCWLVAAPWLPGGRWVAVHLFTLGVVTAVVVGFTRHFAWSFTGHGAPALRARHVVGAVVLAASVVALVTGRLLDGRLLLAAGTLGLLAVVADNGLALRSARRTARVDRFRWVVGTYEAGHAAFLAAAAAGTAVGTGIVPAGWYLGVRDVHLHLNLLGWAGAIVLATLVVFGPALLRGRLRPGAERRAARAVQAAALALVPLAAGVAVASSLDGGVAVVARVVAVAALVVYGTGVVIVGVELAWTARRAPVGTPRLAVVGAAGWFVLAVALDLLVVLTGERGLLDAVGVVLLVGVFGQLILAVLLHLVPLVRRRDTADRETLLRRVERGARARSSLLDLGVAAVTLGILLTVLGGIGSSVLVRGGWAAIVLAVGAHLVPIVWRRPRVIRVDGGAGGGSSSPS